MKRLDKILSAKPTIDDSGSDFSIKRLNTGEITVNDLSFAYEENKPILQDLNFHVPSGGSIAIMGPTGCGKTTIVELLMRVWECEDNMLNLGGKDLNIIPLKVLRKDCVYVPQDSFLFSDSIMENIRFYDKSITDEDVIDAAIAANIHEHIMEFPLGYKTVVGERGMTLSGGQKQRITLARALVRKPKILLLDDAMSAVDSSTEKMILENLRTKISDCTSVIVTPRLSAAALADNILLLNADGSLAEFGGHSELLAKGGAYAKLVELTQNEDTLLQKEGSIDG